MEYPIIEYLYDTLQAANLPWWHILLMIIPTLVGGCGLVVWIRAATERKKTNSDISVDMAKIIKQRSDSDFDRYQFFEKKHEEAMKALDDMRIVLDEERDLRIAEQEWTARLIRFIIENNLEPPVRAGKGD